MPRIHSILVRSYLLFIAILLFCFLPLTAQERGEFPIGAYWTYDSISHDSAMVHLDDLDKIGFNIWSGIETGYLKNSRLHSLLDSAEVHGAEAFIHSYHFSPFVSKREAIATRYEFEDPWTFELGDYRRYHDPEACLEIPCDEDVNNVVVAELGEPTGRLLGGKLNNQLAYFQYKLTKDEFHQFKAHFRFKVESLSSQDDEDVPIIQLEILHRGQGGCTPYWTTCLEPLHTFTINSGEFRDQYVHSDTLEFAIPPGLDNEGKKTNFAAYNFRIRWLGNRSVSVDFLKLENSVAAQLLNGEFDDQMDLVLDGLQKGKGKLKTVMTPDEPNFADWLVQDYFYRYLASRDKKGFATFAVGSREERRLERYRRYLDIAKPHYFAVDFYPIQITSSSEDYPQGGHGIPSFQSSEVYNRQIQENFSLGFFPAMPCASKVAQETGTDLWYLPQSLTVVAPGKSEFAITRPTSNAELSATVFLALSYGVRGLMYFRYSSQIPRKENGTIVFSAVDQNYHHDANEMTVHGKQFYSGISNTWEAVRRTNIEVQKIGPTLLDLDLVHAFAYGEGLRKNRRVLEEVVIQEYIDEVLKCSQKSPQNYIKDIREGSDDATDINLSLFSDRLKQHDYFMLVNRQTFSGATREIDLEFEDHIQNPKEVVDVSNGESHSVSSDGRVRVTLGPGEGKLFKIMADGVVMISDFAE